MTQPTDTEMGWLVASKLAEDVRTLREAMQVALDALDADIRPFPKEAVLALREALDRAGDDDGR